MKLRKITSLTSLLTFILIVLTSVILYIVPQGRVAYWADWRLWGLTKVQWGNIHTINGLLFLLAMFLHIYYNWKPIVSYLKNKTKALKIFTKEFNVALVITLVFTFGTLGEIPPFQWVLDLGDSIKDAAAVKYGEPPYGHAELSSLKTFAKKQGFDLDESMALLKNGGVAFENENQILQDIARQNNISPQQVYLAMKPARKAANSESLPDNPPAGFGNRNLADICQEYQLNVKAVIRGLIEKNLKADAEMTIKEIATAHGLGPMDVFEAIKETAAVSQTASPSGGRSVGSDTPTGLGKMTLADVFVKYNLDPPTALQKLADNSIKANPDDKMKKVAEIYVTTPLGLFKMMK